MVKIAEVRGGKTSGQGAPLGSLVRDGVIAVTLSVVFGMPLSLTLPLLLDLLTAGGVWRPLVPIALSSSLILEVRSEGSKVFLGCIMKRFVQHLTGFCKINIQQGSCSWSLLCSTPGVDLLSVLSRSFSCPLGSSGNPDGSPRLNLLLQSVIRNKRNPSPWTDGVRELKS